MALRNQPYLPLYVQDFLTDEKLIECSALATGIYIRVMCVMHKSETYGTILLKQKDKQSDKQIINFALKLAKFMPWDSQIINNGLEELLNEEVLFIEGDLLLQKRMVKDGIISDKRASAGSKGGKKTLGKDVGFAQAKSQANSEVENEVENENFISNNILYKDTLLKNKEWIKSISNQFKKTETEVLLKMETFFDHLTTEFKVHPSMNEYSKHFKNWLPKNTTENGNTNSKSKQNTNQGYKPASVDRDKLIRELAEDAANGNIPGDYSQKRTGS